MPRQLRTQSETGYYHVITRGVGQQVIFENSRDRSRFIDLLSSSVRKHRINVIAYALMDNHFHLIVNDEYASLSQFMRDISARYAAYYNFVTGHNGHVFQGRFFSKPIQDDAQLLATVRYVLNNPIRAGLGDRGRMKMTSLPCYFGSNGQSIIDNQVVREEFGDIDAFLEFLASDTDEPFKMVATRKLSDQEFRKAICAIAHVDSPLQVKALPKLRRDAALIEFAKLGVSLRQIERETGISRYIIQKTLVASRL